MDDLISRQAAIDSFWKLDVEIRPSAINAIIDMIRTIPPAETPKRTEKSAQNVPNDDLISRKAAIEAVDATWWNARGIRKTIQELPSAQPKTEERTAESVQNVPNAVVITEVSKVRTIDADALYETLCHIWDRSDSEEFEQAVFESIANAPTVEASTWIPCSERLPADDDYRPCYGHDDGAVWWINDIGQMGLGWYYTSTKTWAYYDEISSSEKSVGNVVAWMPLPPSYKGEES